ncbi:MAG: 50S ribosomal protein L11 methyltransferase [Simkaniaceae bacterium]|nr:50S ribosomal protein L11 methyltransferase [Simkaniaceae bacterium]
MEVNWKEQWALFATGFDGEYANIPIENTTFRLYPGPGFGDLSHPTTQIMLQLMRPIIRGRPVIDIGCGSGILSLAAHYLGADSVTAVEIDPDATAHAKKNFELNGLSIPILKETPNIPDEAVVLINMTRGEQEILYAHSPHLIDAKSLIVSGLLAQQKPLQTTPAQSFIIREKWLGFLLIN